MSVFYRDELEVIHTVARKFAFKLKPELLAWSMERCEERILIAGFHEVDGRIPRDQQWKADFVDHFYVHGNSVTLDTVASINSVRRRLNLQPLEFRETDVHDYARSSDRNRKAELRRQTRDGYLALDTLGKIKWLEQAESESAALRPPHFTFLEWKKSNDVHYSAKPALSVLEQTKRAQANAQVQVTKGVPSSALVPPKPSGVERAIMQLKLARKAETIAKIISLVPPDDALSIAATIVGTGEINDENVIDALVARSAEAA